MSGAYGFFLNGLLPPALSRRDRERAILAFAERCPAVHFQELLGCEWWRVRGGSGAAIERLDDADAKTLARALPAHAGGWLDVHVPRTHLEVFVDHGDVLVPGLEPDDYDSLVIPGTERTVTIGSLDAVIAELDDTFADADADPDSYEGLHERLETERAIRRAAEIARAHQLILHGG